MTSTSPALLALPARYLAARKALAEARQVDEVKDIRDMALALELYAFQAKDAQIASDATDIQKRATRRIGELMREYRAIGKLAKGGKPHHKETVTTGVFKTPVTPLTLEQQGIDKCLAKQARKLAAMPERDFELDVAKAKRMAVAAANGDRAFLAEQRAERNELRKQNRAQRERELADATKRASTKLGKKVFGVIYADPPWRYSDPVLGTLDCAVEQHYPTMALEDICALRVPAADDCVLFLWATIPTLPRAFEVIQAWGFIYKSSMVWVKDRAGIGYWIRGQAELLLIATRGDVPAPSPGDQPPAVIDAPRGRHSQKPDVFAEHIERLFPTTPKLEMFARTARSGWDCWGNEAPETSRSQPELDALDIIAMEGDQ